MKRKKELNENRITLRLPDEIYFSTVQLSEATKVNHSELIRIMVINEVERMKSLTDVAKIRSR